LSEYQFYEFLAVDRPLDARQLGEVRALSTRAEITPSSFVNVYHWGNFRGDPRTMMERYYDAHLYLTNWGTREVMLRLPTSVLGPDIVGAYCLTDSSTAWTSGGNVIVAATRNGDGDDDFFDEDGHGKLGSIISVRAELAAGDLRPLYLAWLHSVAEGELSEDDLLGHSTREHHLLRLGNTPSTCSIRTSPDSFGHFPMTSCWSVRPSRPSAFSAARPP
jgi:hypothetical protein